MHNSYMLELKNIALLSRIDGIKNICSQLVSYKEEIMGWQLPLQLGFVFSLLCSMAAEGVVDSPEAKVRLLETPIKYTNNKTAAFSFESPGDQAFGCSKSDGTLFICKIDDSVYSNCNCNCNIGKATYFDLDNGEHSFEVCINGTSQGIIDRTVYGWTIDTVTPTATVTASNSFTTGMNVSVDISFSEPCSTGGSFGCSSVDSCNLLVQGPGEVIPSSLEVVEKYLKYKLLVRLNSTMMSGNVTLTLDEDFCADAAGNWVKRKGKSSTLVVFDRANQSSTLITHIPGKLFDVNGQMRSVHATNNLDNLKFVIHFLQPVVNSSEQILNTIHVNEGTVVYGSKPDNQTFSFMVNNISQSRAVINLTFESKLILTPQGIPFPPSQPFEFLYDTERPFVWLSTPKARTIEDIIPISIHFEKPIAEFNPSNISISGGQLLNHSLKRINTVRYGIKVHAVSDRIYVHIPENITEDLSGNKNRKSESLKVWRVPHSAPAVSVATSSFATASFLGASLASGLLSVSVASLQVSGGASPSSSLTLLPSSNLLRMLSFIQAISLSRWMMDTPNEYYELAQLLQWSIPRYSFPVNEVSELNKTTRTYTLSMKKRTNPSGTGNTDEPASSNPASTGTGFAEATLTCKIPDKNSKIAITYTGDDDDDKYKDNDKDDNNDNDKDKDNGICSSGGEDSNSTNIWKKIGKDNLPLAITTSSVLVVHCLLVLFLKSKRKGSTEKPSNYGGLTFPRIEIFLLLEAITGVCEASSSLIHAWEPLEVLVGCIGLGFVLLTVLAILLFLLVGVTYGKLLHYEEEPHKQEGQTLCKLILGSGGKGRWTWKGRPDSIYLTMFGLLFEDLRGPLHPSLMPSESSTFKDETWKLLRSLSTYYNLMEAMKRVCLGILAGGNLKNWFCKSPAITMLCINLLQLLFVVLVKPFPERRVQLVNIIVVVSEVGIYALGMPLQNKNFFENKESVFKRLMVGLVITGVTTIIANEVYGLYNEVKKLNDPNGNGSFSKGLKIALYGLRSIFTSSSPHSSQCKVDGIENPVPKGGPKSSPSIVAPSRLISKAKEASTPTQIREDAKSTSKDVKETGSPPFSDNIEPQTENPVDVAPSDVIQNVEEISTIIEEEANSAKKDAKQIGSTPYSKNVESQFDDI